MTALSALLGEEAVAGFSASTVTRLLTIWQEEYRGWRKRSLADKTYVYIWADGLYFKVRLGDDRHLACLVIVGVGLDGRKEVIAIEDGYRESTAAWATVPETPLVVSPSNHTARPLALDETLMQVLQRESERRSGPLSLEGRGIG